MRNQKTQRRSKCPLSASLEMLGDRWSLLIVRDLMLHGDRAYKDFLTSGEGISTNILADRLRRLIDHEILIARPDPHDGRKQIYQLTGKGMDLAPVLTEIVLWASAHGETGNPALARQMKQNKRTFVARIRHRWQSALQAAAPRHLNIPPPRFRGE